MLPQVPRLRAFVIYHSQVDKCGAGHVVIPENSVSEAVVRKTREAVWR